MSKSHRVIASLLTVVAVLLGANLLVQSSTPAQAQVRGAPAQVVGVAVDGFNVYRVWTSGFTEVYDDSEIRSQHVLHPLWQGWRPLY